MHSMHVLTCLVHCIACIIVDIMNLLSTVTATIIHKQVMNLHELLTADVSMIVGGL